MRAPFGQALKLAQKDLAIADVSYDPRREAVQANEAKPAHDLPDREELGQLFFVAQAILQGEHGRRRANQRWEQSRKLFVGCGLESNEDEISRADFLGTLGAMRADLEIAVRALDSHAMSPYHFVVGPQEEMNLMADARKFGAVKAPDRSATDDGDLQGSMKKAL
jgi:hypothetical protein